MDANELKQLIKKPEWADVELKSAANKYPKDALSTACAFANSGGGYLIFGIDERKQDPVTGVNKVDEVQNAFINVLKDTQKFNKVIRFNSELLELNDKYILVFQIEEALHHEKPIYLNGDMKQTYLRKGGSDNKAIDEEIKRMVHDASLQNRDERLLDLDTETCFDSNTLKWYRKVYESRHNQKYYDLSHLEFLDQFALIKEENDTLKPTLGAVLMFGTEKHLRQLLPRFVLDAFWHKHNIAQNQHAERWADRRSYECNIFDTWRQVSERFMYFAEQPFDIDESNLQRSHETPDYIGFREAAINALIHQDYSDGTRNASIHFYKDATEYYNPGDSLVDENRLGKGDSATRNPLIMQTFHRVGLSDRAGSGLKDIYRNWQQLDRPKPQIINDKARKTFQITLIKKQTLTKLQQELQQRMGVKLSHHQAQLFIACLEQPQTIDQLANTPALSAINIQAEIAYLSQQGLLKKGGGGYQAPDHFINSLKDLLENPVLYSEEQTEQNDQAQEKVTKLPLKSDQACQQINKKVTKQILESDQAKQLIESLNNKQILIIQQLDQPLSLKELMEKVGQSHRTHFKNKQLQPMIEQQLVILKYPENPHHQDQAYLLTEQGLQIAKFL